MPARLTSRPTPAFAPNPRPVPATFEEFAFAPSRLTVTALGALVRRLGDDTALWAHRLRYDEHERWFTLLQSHHLYDVWLLSWAPGQSTSLHDHGGSSGAFHVLQGAVTETVVHAAASRGWRTHDRTLAAGSTARFGPDYVHDVRHAGDGPAATLHVYSPPLSAMNYYDNADGQLRKVGDIVTDVPEPSWPRVAGHESAPASTR